MLGGVEFMFVSDGFQTGTALRIEVFRAPSVGLSGGEMRVVGCELYLGGLGMTGTGKGGV